MRTACACVTLASLLTAVYAIPWPVGVTPAGQDSSWSLFSSYGNFHYSWEDCADPDSSANFHFGVDIRDYSGVPTEDTVRCVRDGYVTYMRGTPIPSRADSQYVVVICDLMSSQYGWCYQHLDRPGLSEGDTLDLSWPISVMTSLIGNPHLHFMRSDSVYNHTRPGLLNPLDSLVPSAAASEGFTWDFHADDDSIFFLEDMGHLDWPQYNQGHPEDVWDHLVPGDSLSGAVDMFYSYWLTGDGSNPIPMNSDPLNPHRIRWTLFDLLPEAAEKEFTRYVAEFSGPLGGAADSVRYRQFYFRWARREWLFGMPNFGLISCLTNCSDAQGWDGIGNIEESCWQTDIDMDLDDPAGNPLVAAYGDGPYSVVVTSEAWDTTQTHRAGSDVYLCNFAPVVQEVQIGVRKDSPLFWHSLWKAYHQGSELATKQCIVEDRNFPAGGTLELLVVFSEPMDMSTVSVTAGFSSPYDSLTVTHERSTNWNCPEPWADVWVGTLETDTLLQGGRLVFAITGADSTSTYLMDPGDLSGSPGFTDTCHSVRIQPEPELEWSTQLGSAIHGAPCIGDLHGDGDLEVAVQTHGHQMYLLDGAGSILQTWSCGWDTVSFSPVVSSALADLDGDDDLDVIGVIPDGAIAFDSSGSVLSGWPYNVGVPDSTYTGVGFSRASPAVGDLHGGSDPEVILCRHRIITELVQYEMTVYCIDADGDKIWHLNLSNEYPYIGVSVISTPAIADVDGDNDLDVVVAGTNGFQWGTYPDEGGSRPYTGRVYLIEGSTNSVLWRSDWLNCSFEGSPVVADVDFDGDNEVIIGSSASGGSDAEELFVLSGSSGSIEWRSGSLSRSVTGAPAIGDIDGDGLLDMVVTIAGDSCDNLHAYGWNDKLSTFETLSGFPVELPGIPSPSVALADIDADGSLEIVAALKTGDGGLYAYENDGSLCCGFPIGDVHCGDQPVVGNVDDDDALEIIVGDEDTGWLYCWHMGPGTWTDSTSVPWPQHQHNARHTGYWDDDPYLRPPPPTGLTGTILSSGLVELTWERSPGEGDRPDTPVISYSVYRSGGNGDWLPAGYAAAGETSFIDPSSPATGLLRYRVTAGDGFLESDPAEATVSQSGLSNLALGRPVREVYPDRAALEVSTSAMLDRNSNAAVLPTGNARCLTDGLLEESYAPVGNAALVEVYLGAEAMVLGVELSRSGLSLSGGTAPAVEASSDGTSFHPIEPGESCRYVRVASAAGATELLVHGTRTGLAPVEELVVERSSDGWAVPLPQAGVSTTVSIYDLSGRLVWESAAESGSTEMLWDGTTGSGVEAATGMYMVLLRSDGDVSTGRLLLTR